MGMADLGDRNEQECDATKQKWRRVKVRFSSDTYSQEWNVVGASVPAGWCRAG